MKYSEFNFDELLEKTNSSKMIKNSKKKFWKNLKWDIELIDFLHLEIFIILLLYHLWLLILHNNIIDAASQYFHDLSFTCQNLTKFYKKNSVNGELKFLYFIWRRIPKVSKKESWCRFQIVVIIITCSPGITLLASFCCHDFFFFWILIKKKVKSKISLKYRCNRYLVLVVLFISFLFISCPFRNRNEIVEIQKRLITEAKEEKARLDETRQKKIEEKVNNQFFVSCAWKKKRRVKNILEEWRSAAIVD